MDYSADMQIIELDSFMTAFPVDPGDQDAAKRRFMTLLGESETRAKVGGTSYVSRAWTLSGEPLALKRLLPNPGIPEGATLSDEDTARITQGHAAAFYEEYRNQLQVSHLRGFPRLYGYGSIAGTPAIVMEWVEGESLRRLMRDLRERSDQLSGRVVAGIGTSVLEILESLGRLDAALAHRDISPANILIRTTDSSLEEQLERESFDLCLIDFGSSASEPAASDPSFTTATHLWRNGTPEYAPPEMLTRDLPHVDELRKSQKIDVFALCSVLYELYSGHTPWRVSEHAEMSPYRLKTERAPEPLAPRSTDDEPLTRAIMSGLAMRQEDRPSVRELLAVLGKYLGQDSKQTQSATTSGSESPEGARPDSTTPGPTTPDSVNLQVADKAQGGKRAGEAVPTFREETGKPISRRSLIVGGAILAATAIAGGVFTLNIAKPKAERDFSGYAIAENAYTGDPLYIAKQLESNEWIVRNLDGTLIASLGHLASEPGRFTNGLTRVRDGSGSSYGFMTIQNGTNSPAWRILPIFANAKDFTAIDTAALESQVASLAPVEFQDDRLWGFVDEEGSEIFGDRWADADTFSTGYAAVRPRDSVLWGLIDSSGAEVMSPAFAALDAYSNDGIIGAQDPESGRWGYVDLSGAWVLPPSYLSASKFCDGRALVKSENAGNWAITDVNGIVLDTADFIDARPFGADGLAPAKDSRTKLWGLIDTAGTWRVEPRYLKLGDKVEQLWPAHGSPANVYDIYGADSQAWEAYVSGKNAEHAGDVTFGYGYINSDGTWAINPNYGDTLIR